MIYRQRNKESNPLRRKLAAALILFCFLFLMSFFFSAKSRSVLTVSAVPIWFLRDKTINSFAAFKEFFRSKSNLISENETLRQEAALAYLKQTDCSVSDSNGAYGGENGRISANVISKPPFSPYDTFVIGAGSADGVSVGQYVFISERISIGKIAAVSSRTSIVKLFSSGDQKIEAISERTGASFELSGRGGANFVIDAPKDSDIVWGDIFVLPSRSSKTALLGTVYYIDASSQSSFKKIYLRIPDNVFQVQKVFVELF